jgi:two-component system CheB/CheR fusion protein
VLTVRDDGCGFEAALKSQTGLGLRIMSYRAKMISGSLSLHSSPREGTLVRCSFPLVDRTLDAPNAA